MSVIANHQVNLSDRARFPKESENWESFLRILKEEGRADTDHTPELPVNVVDKAMLLFAQAMEAINKRGTPEHWDLVRKLPEVAQNKLNYVIQYGAIFIVEMFDIRRGNEGIDQLTKDHFLQIEDDQFEFRYWRKNHGERSKNHQSDSEKVTESGIIPYLAFTEEFNPGLFMEQYLKFLPPESKYLFPAPRLPSSKFNIHSVNQKTLYEPNKKIGHKTVEKMMGTVALMVGGEHCTNHQIRSTAIRSLRRAHYSWEDISKITGHRNLQSMIENYDPGVDCPDRADMSTAIATGTLMRRGNQFNPVSNHLKKKPDEFSSAYNDPSQMVENALGDSRIPLSTIDLTSNSPNRSNLASKNHNRNLASKNHNGNNLASKNHNGNNLASKNHTSLELTLNVSKAAPASKRQKRSTVVNNLNYSEMDGEDDIEVDNNFEPGSDQDSIASMDDHGSMDSSIVESPVKSHLSPAAPLIRREPKSFDLTANDQNKTTAESHSSPVRSLKENLDKLAQNKKRHLNMLNGKMPKEKEALWHKLKIQYAEQALENPNASEDDIALALKVLDQKDVSSKGKIIKEATFSRPIPTVPVTSQSKNQMNVPPAMMSQGFHIHPTSQNAQIGGEIQTNPQMFSTNRSFVNPQMINASHIRTSPQMLHASHIQTIPQMFNATQIETSPQMLNASHIQTSAQMINASHTHTSAQMMKLGHIQTSLQTMNPRYIQNSLQMMNPGYIQTSPQMMNPGHIQASPQMMNPGHIQTSPQMMNPGHIQTSPQMMNSGHIQTSPQMMNPGHIQTSPQMMNPGHIQTSPQMMNPGHIQTSPQMMKTGHIQASPQMMNTGHIQTGQNKILPMFNQGYGQHIGLAPQMCGFSSTMVPSMPMNNSTPTQFNTSNLMQTMPPLSSTNQMQSKDDVSSEVRGVKASITTEQEVSTGPNTKMLVTTTREVTQTSRRGRYTDWSLHSKQQLAKKN